MAPRKSKAEEKSEQAPEERAPEEQAPEEQAPEEQAQDVAPASADAPLPVSKMPFAGVDEQQLRRPGSIHRTPIVPS